MNTNSSGAGLVCAAVSYLVWGMYPFYWVLITRVPIFELLAHRMIWSLAFVLLLLPLIDGIRPIVTILRQPKLLSNMLLCSALIGINWSLYVYSISINRVLEASLGYYLGPLFTTASAMIFLGERLRGLQYYALGLVLVGIIIAMIMHGYIPWIGLGLAVTFSLYSTLRRHVKLSALSALSIEVMIPALLGLSFLAQKGGGQMMNEGADFWALVMLSGPLTIIPLVLYGLAVNRAPLIPVALMFYLVPTCLFVISTLVFHEPFHTANAVLFGFVWAGVALYAVQTAVSRSQPMAKP